VAVSEQDSLRLSDASGGLQMQVLAQGHQFSLVLTGELDLRHAAEVEATIRRLCASGVICLVIDLRGLRFIDSTGVTLLMNAGKLCEENGHEYRLIPGPRNVHRIFEILALDRVLPFSA